MPVRVRISAEQKFDRDAALAMARSAERVIASRGTRVQTFEMKSAPPSDAELAAAILGPTGNLRAPSMRRGSVLYVGFNATAWRA